MVDQAIKETGQREAANKRLRGGFSEYVEQLIYADLKKKGVVVMTKIEHDKFSLLNSE